MYTSGLSLCYAQAPLEWLGAIFGGQYLVNYELGIATVVAVVSLPCHIMSQNEFPVFPLCSEGARGPKHCIDGHGRWNWWPDSSWEIEREGCNRHVLATLRLTCDQRQAGPWQSHQTGCMGHVALLVIATPRDSFDWKKMARSVSAKKRPFAEIRVRDTIAKGSSHLLVCPCGLLVCFFRDYTLYKLLRLGLQ